MKSYDSMAKAIISNEILDSNKSNFNKMITPSFDEANNSDPTESIELMLEIMQKQNFYQILSENILYQNI